MAEVLRLRVGDRIIVLDSSGWQCEVELTSLDSGSAIGVVKAKSLVTTEPRTKITIYQGLLRGERFEYVLQKGTELGVVGFVPTICERCVVSHIREANSAKWQRWQKIIIEAAEQSERGKLPTLRPATMFGQACENIRGLSLLALEREQAPGLRHFLRQQLRENGGHQAPRRLFSINIFVGPEGGFSREEVQRARGYNIVPVSLGPRILRAETAAIAATTVIMAELGDLGD
jgi:16S rRNA (uracil1498-N3)-methyltransferase